MSFILALIALVLEILFKVLGRIPDDYLLLFALLTLAILIGGAPPVNWAWPWRK